MDAKLKKTEDDAAEAQPVIPVPEKKHLLCILGQEKHKMETKLRMEKESHAKAGH